MSAILAQVTTLKQYWPSHFAVVPILLSGSRSGSILHSRVEYSGPYEKSHAIISNTFILAYIRTYKHAYNYACIFTYIHLLMYIYIYTHNTYLHTYIHTFIYMHTYRHTCIHTNTCMHTYINTRMHSYIHKEQTYILKNRLTCIHSCAVRRYVKLITTLKSYSALFRK